MKLKALDRGFYVKDITLGRAVIVSPGQEFEKDYALESEEINNLIQDLRCTVIDDEYVKPFARYQVKNGVTNFFQGEKFTCEFGSVIALPRDLAIFFMVKNYIRPEDPKMWWPGKLPEFNELITKTVKRMFDAPKTAVKKWVTGFKKNANS